MSLGGASPNGVRLVRVSRTSLYTGDPQGVGAEGFLNNGIRSPVPIPWGWTKKRVPLEAQVIYRRWCHDGETQAWDVLGCLRCSDV